MSSENPQSSDFISVFSPEFPYKRDVLKEMSKEDNEPLYDWRRYYSYEESKLGREDDGDINWSQLSPSMREMVVFDHYIERVQQFTQQNAPGVWDYIRQNIKGLTPSEHCTTIAEWTGGNFVRIHPDKFIAAINGGDKRHLAELVAAIAHEAKHIELAQAMQEQEGEKDNIIYKNNFDGAMAREEACYRFHEALYERITGEKPTQTWLNVKKEYAEIYAEQFSV